MLEKEKLTPGLILYFLRQIFQYKMYIASPFYIEFYVFNISKHLKIGIVHEPGEQPFTAILNATSDEIEKAVKEEWALELFIEDKLNQNFDPLQYF